MGNSARILVVDDSKVMRGIIRKMLAAFPGVSVLEARDGKDAWELLQVETVDLILSDWNMPRMKGIDLLRQVRSHADMSELPFVMVTAEAREDNHAEADTARVSSYLTKPFTSETLRRVLAPFLPLDEATPP
ncbi:MAG: response regulator [Desulfovibrionaceae bacterium]|nr:response regulator [Desulfovibrionaceae bacterium]